jgi:hypothetical protein
MMAASEAGDRVDLGLRQRFAKSVGIKSGANRFDVFAGMKIEVNLPEAQFRFLHVLAVSLTLSVKREWTQVDPLSPAAGTRARRSATFLGSIKTSPGIRETGSPAAARNDRDLACERRAFNRLVCFCAFRNRLSLACIRRC